MGAGQRRELEVPYGRLEVQTYLALVVDVGVAGHGAFDGVSQPQVQEFSYGRVLRVEVEALVGVIAFHLPDPGQRLGAVLLGGPQASGAERTVDGELDVLAT